ncbi:hypothetical protein [Geobacter sp. SVR]|uniref:hypothetical protein n=1 Tax=Geobacter sp. SVR TaxID=2495594 RepID=UPI00143F030B|nr:hypothetical protein [Geobacter sp. SVR]BCS55249.1 hypothetical protein GSVR_35570 [Geobacter sp. SVR]GCF86048.1 hypothetical protein GSbR_26480 [Geobacter sp. SVR]
MKRIRFIAKLYAALVLATLLHVGSVSAEEIKMVGTITKIELAANGQSATATLKDSKTGETVTIMVTDELTLDKFKDKRIVEGDEIRCKFEKEDNRNSSKLFRKTAGC